MQQQRTVIEDKRFTQEGENTVIVSGVLRGVFFNWSIITLQCCCYARCPNPQAGREKASKTMQLAKREIYC